MKYITLLLTSLFIAGGATAQTKADSASVQADTTAKRRGSGNQVSIGAGEGIYIGKAKSDSNKRFIEFQFGMLDLGVNILDDKTDYSSAAARNFLRVPGVNQNEDLFALRTSKSVNVNIYPVLAKARLVDTRNQKLTLSTGLGLQLYNFRFNKPLSYRNDPQPYVALDSISFSKNKLALNYLSVPLLVTSRTRLTRRDAAKGGLWLVYGAGVSGGFLLSSWTKQVSPERGKDKNHDPFNLRSTNLCVNAEIGIHGLFRLYGSYQLTPLHENALVQHPLSIGIRFLGI